VPGGVGLARFMVLMRVFILVIIVLGAIVEATQGHYWGEGKVVGVIPVAIIGVLMGLAVLWRRFRLRRQRRKNFRTAGTNSQIVGR
jgi:hypothetical protein